MKHIIAYEGLAAMSLGLLQEAYGPLFVPWANRRIDVEGTHIRPPYWPNDFVEWLNALRKDKGRNEVFAILLKTKAGKTSSYRYVGQTGIHDIQWPQGVGTTGSIIGVKSAQGMGVGTEAKFWLLHHSFNVLGLRKVISHVKGFNLQSAAHLIKCGYKFVGKYRRHIPHDGKFVDDVLFEVFPEDWEPIWNLYKKTRIVPKLTKAQQKLLKEVFAS
ncbi:MAG: GNAT family protein [Candidatus Pacebacteria bacterium]|nr:GNAT family protein [Candidatus Paceibacterota bacterium]